MEHVDIPKPARNDCGVSGCTRRKSDPGATFFVMPKAAKENRWLYNKWIKALEWTTEEVKQDLKICNSHFDESFFVFNAKGHKRLNEFAYPHKSLPSGVDLPAIPYFITPPKIREVDIVAPLSNHRKCPEMANKIETIHPLENITNSKNRSKSSVKNVNPLFTTNTNAPRKLPLPKKLEDPTKPKLILQDGKVLTPIKLKRKLPKEPTPPKKDRSIIMLENGVVVFKKSRLETTGNSINISNFTADNSLNTSNETTTAPLFYTEVLKEEYEHEEEILQEIPSSPIMQPKQESPKVLFKDGKILKQVKFKRKKNPVLQKHDSLQLPDIDQSAHLVEYIEEFPNFSDSNITADMMYSEEYIQVDDSPQVEEALTQEIETESSVLESSVEYLPYDEEYQGHEAEIEEENTVELETIKLDNGVKIEFQALGQSAKRGRPRNDNLILTICSVPGCNTKKNMDSKDTSSFMFLRNQCKRFDQWAEAIKLKPPLPKILKICFNHFKESDILINHLGKRRIHSMAVPSLNLPAEKTSKIVTKTGLVLKPVKFKMPTRK